MDSYLFASVEKTRSADSSCTEAGGEHLIRAKQKKSKDDQENIVSAIRSSRIPAVAMCALIVLVATYVLGVQAVSSQGLFIRSQYLSGELPFEPKSPLWEKASPMLLPLSGQVITRPTLPDPTIKSLTVRSLHNGKDIVFLLEWHDPTKNDRLTPGTFRDGAAMAFPLGDAPAFFCMGQLDHYLNIWHWKADWQTDIERRKAKEQERKAAGTEGEVRRFEVIPRRASSVEDLLGGGFSTLTSKRGQGTVQGNAVWEQGRWKVVFKRSLETRDPDNDAIFGPGRIQTVAFAVWNGENKERNGQKAVAPWLQLTLDPITAERVEKKEG
jgi:DMSO reductase family type II enzyme heme b subunit